MKKTLYWVVIRSTGKAIYSFDKQKSIEAIQMLGEWDVEKEMVLYSVETEFTDKVLESLLNGNFNHCYLPNYRDAKSIDINHEGE